MTRKREDIQINVSHDQISRLVVMGIMGMLFVFIAGYYLGKRNQSEEFTDNIKQDAFADHIYSSLSTLYEPSETTNSVEQVEKNGNSA